MTARGLLVAGVIEVRVLQALTALYTIEASTTSTTRCPIQQLAYLSALGGSGDTIFWMTELI